MKNMIKSPIKILPLTDFEQRIKNEFLCVKRSHGDTCNYIRGFIYVPQAKMKIRISKTFDDFMATACNRYMRDGDYQSLFVLDLKNERSFEDQWFGNQTFGRCQNYNDAFSLLKSGERIYPERIRQAVIELETRMIINISRRATKTARNLSIH